MYHALNKAGYILQSNFTGDTKKIGWLHSSRTDKGVHSVSLVVSVKLEFTPHDVLELSSNLSMKKLGLAISSKINQYLPSDIRVLSVQKTSDKFHPRFGGIWREYEYLLPLSVIGEHSIAEFNTILSKFKGFKLFHNFTSSAIVRNRRTLKAKENPEQYEDAEPLHITHEENGVLKLVKNLDDKRILGRSVTELVCENPIRIGDQDVVVLRIKGNSFMGQQIRKMVGTAVAVHCKVLPREVLDISLESDVKFNTPCAPAVPLILNGVGFRERIGGEAYMDVNNTVLQEKKQEFKKNVLYPHIMEKLRDGTVLEQFFSNTM